MIYIVSFSATDYDFCDYRNVAAFNSKKEAEQLVNTLNLLMRRYKDVACNYVFDNDKNETREEFISKGLKLSWKENNYRTKYKLDDHWGCYCYNIKYYVEALELI